MAERMLSNDTYSTVEQLYPDAAYYSAKNNWPDILSKLIGKGVDINALTDGQTPLYAACKEGYESVVILLLNNGADPNVPNKLTSSSKDLSLPLLIAIQRGHAVIFEMLLEKGASMNQPGVPMLHIACGTESKTGGEREETRSVEQTLSVIKLLLQQGVDVNAISDVGDTALYRACISQQLQVVQFLLEAGADVNMTSCRRYPLMAACRNGNIAIVDCLLINGADSTFANTDGNTPLHFAIERLGKQANSEEIRSNSYTLTTAQRCC